MQYSVQCTIIFYITVYSVQYIMMYIEHCKVHSVQYTLYSVQYTVDRVHCTVYSVQCLLVCLGEYWGTQSLPVSHSWQIYYYRSAFKKKKILP